MKIETQNLDLVEEVCRNAQQLSVMTWKSFVSKYFDTAPASIWDTDFLHNKLYSWYNYFINIQPYLNINLDICQSFISNLQEELALNHFKASYKQDNNLQKQLYERLHDSLMSFIDPTINCYEQCLRRMESRESMAALQADKETGLFVYFCLAYHKWKQSSFYNTYALNDLDFDSLVDAVAVLNIWKQKVLSTLTLLETEYGKSKVAISSSTNTDYLTEQNAGEHFLNAEVPELIMPDKGLSAPQKLLFIRLLQQEGLFPKKPDNTDDAPELRAIALMAGLDYMNDIKGGNGANVKVKAILDPVKRLKFTNDQLIHKLGDIDAVLNVARLLNVKPVVSALDLIRADLEKIRDSR